jgi:hypothetical protein
MLQGTLRDRVNSHNMSPAPNNKHGAKDMKAMRMAADKLKRPVRLPGWANEALNPPRE